MGYKVAILLLLLAGLGLAGETRALEIIERADHELLIFDLELGRVRLSEGFYGYEAGDGEVLLPFSALMTALDFAIEVDVGNGTASGWFLAEDRGFFLDLQSEAVWIAGQPALWRPLVELHSDDLYVGVSLLERWFPIDFEIDRLQSRIRLRSREKLPVELKMERRLTWQRVGGLKGSNGPRFVRQALPYRAVDWPMIDHRLTYTLESDEEASSWRSDLIANGDFLFMNAELAALWSGGSRSAEPDLRLRLGRQDPGGALLGRLRATEVAVGDLTTPRSPLVSLETYALGFEVHSFPTHRPEQFDRTTLRGDALEGWEIELYHNEALIAFLTVPSTNRYEFADVPLYLGQNLLRLVFYGPQGQRQEKLERFLIGPDLVRQGDHFYRFAIHQQDRRLWSESSREIDPSTSAQGEPRWFFEWEQGLSAALSLSTQLQSLIVEDERHHYAGLALFGTRRGVLGQARLVADLAGGWAGRLSAEGQLERTRFRLEHELWSDFTSESHRGVDPPLERSTAQFELRSLRSSSLRRPLRLSVAADREQRLGGGRTSASIRLSMPTPRFTLSQSLEWYRDVERRSSLAENQRLTASLLAVGRWGRLRWRGGVTSILEGEDQGLDVSFTADVKWKASLSSRFLLRRAASDSGDIYAASLNWRARALALGVDLRWQESEDFRLALTLSYSLRREPYSGHLQTSSRPVAQQGGVAARVFLDQNLNGHYDADDEPLPGVGFQIDGGRRAERTDASGTLLLASLDPHRHLDVALDIASLEDPYWLTRREGVGVVARPGRIVELAFPVVVSSEIDGTVYGHNSLGEPTELAGIELELVDPEGEVVARARTAFDGFYLFDKILPGHYILRLSADSKAQFQKGFKPPRIIIDAGGEIKSGIDLWVEKKI